MEGGGGGDESRGSQRNRVERRGGDALHCCNAGSVPTKGGGKMGTRGGGDVGGVVGGGVKGGVGE